MIVRSVDVNGDWLFGKGRNDYKSAKKAVAQCIQTRLSSFLGDCFFATTEGIDWFNLLGAKNQLALNLAVSAMILNTKDVISIAQLSINLDRDTRQITIKYDVQTNFGVVSAELPNPINLLLTEDGDPIVTEDGEFITV